jgi:uroporphyrinogen decarboxylase
MRQAGRYLPEYRATRAKAGSFLGDGEEPGPRLRSHAAAAGALRLDAAILFSDILTVPDAMGLGLYFVEGEGPKFERPVRTRPPTSRSWRVPDMDKLRYVMDAVR